MWHGGGSARRVLSGCTAEGMDVGTEQKCLLGCLLSFCAATNTMAALLNVKGTEAQQARAGNHSTYKCKIYNTCVFCKEIRSSEYAQTRRDCDFIQAWPGQSSASADSPQFQAGNKQASTTSRTRGR